MGNNPVKGVDKDGGEANPIYDIDDGSFLGTDELGLKGEAILMKGSNFKQGMSHAAAMSYGTFLHNFNGPIDIKLSVYGHSNSLVTRPDFDGFVTIEEGIAWAKAHPNKRGDPNDALYIDASKLNFGDLSVNNIGLAEGEQKNINLLDHVTWFSNSSRATTYAFGNTQIKLIDAKNGIVQLFSDGYDWDYHHFKIPKSEVLKFGQHPSWPTTTRDNLIYMERLIKGLNDSHGVDISIYGFGTIRTN